MLLAATVTLAATLTFPAALERALAARAATARFDEHARVLESLPSRTLPTVRAETGVSSAENLNLLNQNTGRVDAFVALVNVDYPLFGSGAAARRSESIAADAAMLRQRATEEAGQVFEQTLTAFADLATAEARLGLLAAATDRAGALRTRADSLRDSGLISNTTAAQWQDQALAVEAQLVDLQVQRLDAETRLKQLLGDTSPEVLHAAIDLADDPAAQQIHLEPSIDRDPSVARAALEERRRRLALTEAIALQRPQVLLSAFGGVAAVPDAFRSSAEEGTFGVYGLRLSMTLPLLDGASARRVAQARIEAEDAARARTLTEASAQNRAALLGVAIGAADQRIALLTSAVDVARRRYESVQRLVASGVRTDADLGDAAANIARRESDLAAVRIERWKLVQRAKWRP